MKVINSPEAELSTGRTVVKKKSPFKNTLKKKNGKYTSYSKPIKRGRARVRETPPREPLSTPVVVRQFRDHEKFSALDIKAETYRWRRSNLTKIFKP